MDTKIDEILSYTAGVLPGSQSISEGSVKFLESYKAIANDYGQCCGLYTSLGSSDDDYGSYGLVQVFLALLLLFIVFFFSLFSS